MTDTPPEPSIPPTPSGPQKSEDVPPKVGDDVLLDSVSEPEPSPRTPVDPVASATPPPPPPPNVPMPYPMMQPPPRGGLRKVLTLIFGALGIFVLGFYVAIFSILSQNSVLSESVYQSGEASERVAIIPIRGIITSDTAGYVRLAVREVLTDDTIKAVILRVESPGGGVNASDLIRKELLKLKKVKEVPVVASYGYLAASGGYYVSCFADHIYAEPTGQTGSIGVVAMAYNINKLITNNGIEPHFITSTAAKDHKTTGSPFLPWEGKKAEDKFRIQLDYIQERFVSIVDDGRKDLDREGVMEVAKGDIYVNETAKENGLVDDIGYLDDAIEHLVKKEGLFTVKRPQIVTYVARTGLLSSLMARSSTQSVGSSATDLRIELDRSLEVNPEKVRAWAHELGAPRMMLLMPY